MHTAGDPPTSNAKPLVASRPSRSQSLLPYSSHAARACQGIEERVVGDEARVVSECEWWGVKGGWSVGCAGRPSHDGAEAPR